MSDNSLSQNLSSTDFSAAVGPQGKRNSVFKPVEPETLEGTHISKYELENLVLKYLFSHGSKTGREIANQLKLNYSIVEKLTSLLKSQMFIGHCGSSAIGDFEFELAPAGFDRVKRAMEHCTYCGAAPVGLSEYISGIRQQTVKSNQINFDMILDSYKDLVLSKTNLSQIGQAVSSGRCLFLYGPPGNGKTSVATRAIRAMKETIWIPRSIGIGGEVIRLFDSNIHEEANASYDNVDKRWVCIKRPCVVVGGELTIEALEVSRNPVSGILEAPVHLKSNGGCLVIDDFGRQRISPTELLNRWIVPLERREDYMNLPNGRHITIPFDQLLVFSTNLNPAELCDEAFLRRIPNKIEMLGPTKQQFLSLFNNRATSRGFEYSKTIGAEMLERHFEVTDRTLRFCHADDVLELAEEFCRFHRLPKKLTPEILDFSIKTYFAGI